MECCRWGQWERLWLVIGEATFHWGCWDCNGWDSWERDDCELAEDIDVQGWKIASSLDVMECLMGHCFEEPTYAASALVACQGIAGRSLAHRAI